MNLQNPKKFKMLVDQAHETAINVLRPISSKYDKAEHAYPKRTRYARCPIGWYE